MDFITWARFVPFTDYLRALPSLVYPAGRPVGYAYYWALNRIAGLNYGPWVVALQLIGVVNVSLLWLLMRKSGLGEAATAAGCLFFVSSRALFDAWSTPRFIYDVLCTTFALTSLLAYAHRKWVLSFAAFWLGMRSKEIGVAIPVLLLCYELTLGDRKWKRIIPFALPAAFFGASGLWSSLHMTTLYRVRFAPQTMWKTMSYYSSALLWIPYAGCLMLLLPFATRDRRAYFGVGAMVCGVAIYLLLPDRLLEAYLYLAMTGAAIGFAAFSARYPLAAAILALAWIPWQCVLIRQQARVALDEADQRRAYVSALRTAPDASAYLYSGAPDSLHDWGVEAALRIFHGNGVTARSLDGESLPESEHMQLLTWDAKTRRMRPESFSPNDYASLPEAARPAEWQRASGWSSEGGYRALLERASVRLFQSGRAVEFTWEACGAPDSALGVFLDGEQTARVVFSKSGCVNSVAPVKAGLSRMVTVDFLVEPAGRPVRIGAFGFRSP